MNLSFSAWSIRHPVPSVVLFLVLCVVGAMAFARMPVTKFPNIDVPFIAVSVTQSGAAPAELETQVTRKIEDAVANLTGVKHVHSTITDGHSSTLVEFRLETETDRAYNDVKDAIDKIRSDLPRDIDEPIVSRIEVEGQAILTYAVSAPAMTLEQLSWYTDDVIKRQLQGLKGVGRVDRFGGLNREIRVSLDPDRLMALGVTASDVNRQLRSTNTDLAGGRGDVAGQEQAIRTLASAKSVEALADSKITLPGGRQVRLADLGRVIDEAEEPRSFARVGGEPVVAIAVFRSKGSSEVDVADGVMASVKRLMTEHPDVKLTLIDDGVRYTRGNYEANLETLIEGAVLAVLVVLVFLRDFRATIISAIALPLSIIPTYAIMQMLGFSLNLVSMLALTLATGILVDDAIVEIENIVRHMRMGKSAYRAALEAADEIGMAVIAITLTIIAVFAPVSFMSGIAGQYFRQFGLTVAAAVFVSLLVARLVTPMLAAYFLRSSAVKAEHHDGPVMRAYTSVLGATLRWRWLTLIGGVLIFALSFYAIRFLPTGFIPDGDEGRSVISVELPPGSSLDDTARVTDLLQGRIKHMPEVATVLAVGGATATGAGEVRNAVMYIQYVPKKDRSLSQKHLEERIGDLLSEVPDIRSWVVRGDERQVAMSLLSNDPIALDKAAGELERAMRHTPGLLNVAPNAGLERPEIRVLPRLDKAAELGIDPATISEAVRVATIGDVTANLAKFNAGDRLVPIRVQLKDGARGNLDLLRTLSIRTGSGAAVPLISVADVEFGQGPSSISRYDRERRIVIGADRASGLELGDAIARVQALPEAKTLPSGVRIQQTGDAEIMAEVFQGFAIAMITGLMIVFGLLILLLGNVFQPITILLSLPLSVGGVIGGLLLTNNAISMPVVIGILMLMGIVTKNAILLVDFAVEEVRKGIPRLEAIMDAGRKRARPIIMTTIAMAAGMLPTALGYGDGGEFRAPMAIAVIGGLIVSTMLSLVFVPSLYTVMDDVAWIAGRIFGRFVGPRDEPDDHAVAPRAVPEKPPARRPYAEAAE